MGSFMTGAWRSRTTGRWFVVKCPRDATAGPGMLAGVPGRLVFRPRSVDGVSRYAVSMVVPCEHVKGGKSWSTDVSSSQRGDRPGRKPG